MSGLIREEGTPARMLIAARQGAFRIVTSAAINEEILEVIQRPRSSARYGLTKVLPELAELLNLKAEIVRSPGPVKRSADPDDDKFLAAAVAGRAGCLVTGDAPGLLMLKRFQGVSILPPVKLLSLLSRQSGDPKPADSE